MSSIDYIDNISIDVTNYGKCINRIFPYRPYWMTKKTRGFSTNVYELIKKELFKRILSDFPYPYLYCDDYNPSENGLKGRWTKVDSIDGTWIIPDDSDPEELLKFWGIVVGEWFIYKSINGQPIEIDFKNYNLWEPSELVRLFLEKQFAFLLWSCADNDPWFLGIKEAYSNSGQ